MRDLGDSIPVKISIGDGRYVDAEEVMRLFSFPRAETPEKLAKIKAKNVSCSRKCEQTTDPTRVFFARRGLDEVLI